MITDTDIRKMKSVFVTRKDFYKALDELTRLITGGFSRVDEAINELKEQSDILNDHERRLDRVEDKVFA